MQISSSGAITTTGVISGSNALSASYAATASFVTTAQTASFVTLAQTASFVANAQSASNAVTAQTASFANAFTVAGTLTAQTLVVQTITSSVDYVTGSTRFGSSLSNTHVFSGSVTMNPGGLFVSSSGLVGIGTIAPAYNLDVTGNGRFTGNVNIDGERLTIGGTSNNAIINNIASVRVNIDCDNTGTGESFMVGHNQTGIDSNNVLFKVQDDGKVGIGLTAPDLTLTINGAMNLRNSTRAGAIEIDSSGNLWIGTATTAGNIYLETGHSTTGLPSTGTARLTLNSSGAATFSSSVTAGGGKPQLYVSGDSSNGAGIHLTTALSGTNRRNWGVYTEELVDGDFVIKCSTAAGGNPNTGNARFVISRDGNVGIGTNSPSAQGLTIYQGGSDRRIMLELNRPNSPGLQSAIQFTVGSSILVGQIQHEYVTDNYNHMSFTLRSPGGSNFVSMWLQNSGYVGIGNSNPATKLNVNNTVAGALLPYINGTGLSYNSEGISVAGSNTNNTNIGNGLALFNNVASVGAYSPVIAFSSMTSGGAYNATYAFISGVYQGAGGDANWSKGDMIFGTGNSYGATMRLKLTQDGALLPGADNSYGFGGSGIRWAAIWAANGTIQTSDEREKKDIINADLGLDFINKLRPVSYKWKVGQNEVVSEFDGMDEDGKEKYKTVIKPREGKRTHYGLIAQEVEALLDGKDFGGFIHDENTDTKGLRYDQFIAPLIKAIQELKAENDTLKEILQRNNIQ